MSGGFRPRAHPLHAVDHQGRCSQSHISVNTMNSFRIRLVAAIGLSIISTVALAHAMLQRANPPVGGTLKISPTEIKLQFSESVEPKFSGITLTASDGMVLPTSQPTVDPQNRSVLTVEVGEKLDQGTYTVRWHAVSVDTHRTEGSFTFTIE